MAKALPFPSLDKMEIMRIVFLLFLLNWHKLVNYTIFHEWHTLYLILFFSLHLFGGTYFI